MTIKVQDKKDRQTKKTNQRKRPLKEKPSNEQPNSNKFESGCLRFIRNTFIIIILLAVIIVAGISYFAYHTALTPGKSSAVNEEKYEYMYSEYPFLRRWVKRLKKDKNFNDYYIFSSDSAKLHAYYILAPKPTNKTAVVVHGHNNNAIDMLHIAYMYNHDLNFNVLLPDLKAHGLSQGDYTQFGWLDRFDILKWMDTANELFGGDTRMVVHGISMGAATTMMVSGEKQPQYMRAFVEDCGYTSVWDELSYVADRDYSIPQMPFIELASLLCEWQHGWSFKEASCIEQLKKSTLPMLFIHGEADNYVPTWMVYKLYQAKPNNKDIWTVPNVMHARAYHDRPKEYTQRVEAFVNMFVNDK